jgi:pyruvate dehydrogenase E2 component (dihydrolipoamide acetyltransferase)
MSTTIEVRVPDIGDFKDIPIIEMLVKPGDVVKKEQSVVTLESEKATVDVPAPAAGRVSSLAVAAGTRVSEGSLILTLDLQEVVEPPQAVAAKVLVPEPILSPVEAARSLDDADPQRGGSALHLNRAARRPTSPPPTIAARPSVRIYASPSIRRLGRELGADLAGVTGSGRGGRILLDDVYKSVRGGLQTPSRSAVASAERSVASVDFAKYGELERRPLSRIRRISGPALARNWSSIPHVTNFDEADVTDLDSFRVKLNQELGGNPKITLLSFLVKVIAATLRFAPAFNASLDGEELILKKYVNVGVAVDTPEGLMVPVIRGADRLGIIDIARELSSKAAAAQAGRLKASDFEGGCFTVSSLGGVGGTGFTPIINAPEIAILGAAKATIIPRYDGAQFQPRLILPLALSWDHRATDGAAAAGFLVHLVSLLEDFRRISL